MNTVDIDSQVGSYFGYTCIGNFISNIVSMGIIIAGLMVLLYLVWGGIEWMSSGGDKAKTELAQKRLTNAIIGLAILPASWALWKIILYFFGVNLDALCTQNPLKN
jgi:hypothetical protein